MCHLCAIYVLFDSFNFNCLFTTDTPLKHASRKPPQRAWRMMFPVVVPIVGKIILRQLTWLRENSRVCPWVSYFVDSKMSWDGWIQSHKWQTIAGLKIDCLHRSIFVITNHAQTIQKPFASHSHTIHKPFTNHSTTNHKPFINHSTTNHKPFINHSRTMRKPPKFG